MEQSVLVTGFPGLDYALEHRGWGVDMHSIFTRGPQGSFAAAKNVLRPFQFAKSPITWRISAVGADIFLQRFDAGKATPSRLIRIFRHHDSVIRSRPDITLSTSAGSPERCYSLRAAPDLRNLLRWPAH
jgi:hypothetical protein